MKIPKTDKSIKCAMFPSPYLETEWMQSQHPFLLRIANELRQLNYECVPTPPIIPNLQWLITNHRTIDVIHLHWPEQFYKPFLPPLWVRLVERITGRLKIASPVLFLYFLRFAIFLMFVRLFRIPLVWTLHDLYPHGQSNIASYDRIARKLLMRNIEVLILNCCAAKQLVVEEFGEPKHVVVAPLGNYRKFYPDVISTDEARQQLGIHSSEIVFLCFGTMRKHRNALSVIQAFRQLPGNNLRLFIAGQGSGALRDEMEKAAWGDWRIHCFFQLVPNEQIESFFKASDFVIMPGVQYLTSAVVTLALSYDRPVIAPKYGCAIDMVGDAGILYDDQNPNGLTRAMEQAKCSDLDQYKCLARQRAESFSWELTAARIAEAYQIACRI